VQRSGVEKIEQHQIQGVGSFGRERATIEGAGGDLFWVGGG
jgi:hypothetical protein